jgi:hypothetical protein
MAAIREWHLCRGGLSGFCLLGSASWFSIDQA